jgi:hypothetical protein
MEDKELHEKILGLKMHESAGMSGRFGAEYSFMVDDTMLWTPTGRTFEALWPTRDLKGSSAFLFGPVSIEELPKT